MSSLVNELLTVSPVWVYCLVGLLVFAEDAIFVGFVLPGETAAVLGGVAASLGHVDLPAILAVVVGAAIVGDSVGYEVGARLGPHVLDARPLRRHRERLAGAEALLARRGGSAVFLGRFVAFFRAVMPALAGMSRMRYRTFVTFNAVGGLVWGTAFVLLGYAAGTSYPAVEHAVGRGATVAVLVVLAVGLLVWRLRGRAR